MKKSIYLMKQDKKKKEQKQYKKRMHRSKLKNKENEKNMKKYRKIIVSDDSSVQKTLTNEELKEITTLW